MGTDRPRIYRYPVGSCPPAARWRERDAAHAANASLEARVVRAEQLAAAVAEERDEALARVAEVERRLAQRARAHKQADRDEAAEAPVADAALFAQDRMLTPLREPTAEDIAAWLHAHPDQVAAVLARAYVADAWHEEYGVWSRRLVGDDPDADDFAMVDFDEETDRWVVELRDVGHDDDYATAAEAMAAADKVLVEDGYALVGGVPDAG